MRRSYPMMKQTPCRRHAGWASRSLAAGLAGCSGDARPRRRRRRASSPAGSAVISARSRSSSPPASKVAADRRRRRRSRSSPASWPRPRRAAPRRRGRRGREGSATATVNVDWTLPGGTHWTYPSTVRLTQGNDDVWQVIWEPTVVNAKLKSGDQLGLRRQRPARRRRPGRRRQADRRAARRGRGRRRAGRRRRPRAGSPRRWTRRSSRSARRCRRSTSATCRSRSPRPRTPSSSSRWSRLREEAYLQIRSEDPAAGGHQVPRGEARPGPDPGVRPRAARLGRPGAQGRHRQPARTRYAEGDLVGHGGIQGRSTSSCGVRPACPS